MLNFSQQTRVQLFLEPVDMRKSFRGLCQIVESQLQQDPASGQWFVFVNRAGDRMKLLGWDGHGLWIWYKLLERGRFELPQADGAHAEIDVTQLSMIIQGVALTAPRRLRYQPRPAG